MVSFPLCRDVLIFFVAQASGRRSEYYTLAAEDPKQLFLVSLIHSRGGISSVCGGGGPHDQNQFRSHFGSSVLDALDVRVLGAMWKLQQWRTHFPERSHRYDTAEEELNEKEIQKVKTEWQMVNSASSLQ